MEKYDNINYLLVMSTITFLFIWFDKYQRNKNKAVYALIMRRKRSTDTLVKLTIFGGALGT